MSVNPRLKLFFAATILSSLVFCFAGCSKDQTEEAIDDIEEIGEETSDAIDNAIEESADAIKDAIDQ